MSKQVKRTVSKWIKGLLAAALGGAVSVIMDPHSVVNDPKSSAKVAAGGAIIAVIGYLKQSPLETSDDSDQQ